MALGVLPTPVGVLRSEPTVYATTIPCWRCSWAWSHARGKWRRCWPCGTCEVHGDPGAPAPETVEDP
jgi:hypothetical protein